jgi:hypothetical protein
VRSDEWEDQGVDVQRMHRQFWEDDQINDSSIRSRLWLVRLSKLKHLVDGFHYGSQMTPLGRSKSWVSK